MSDLPLFVEPSTQPPPTVGGGMGDAKADKILFAVRFAGSDGMTTAELAIALGMQGNYARARLSELRRAGLIGEAGQRPAPRSGKPSTVWTAANLPPRGGGQKSAAGVGQGGRQNMGVGPSEARRGKPCRWCGLFAWWRSIFGRLVCGACHPPATPEVVAEWLKPPPSPEPPRP